MFIQTLSLIFSCCVAASDKSLLLFYFLCVHSHSFPSQSLRLSKRRWSTDCRSLGAGALACRKPLPPFGSWSGCSSQPNSLWEWRVAGCWHFAWRWHFPWHAVTHKAAADTNSDHASLELNATRRSSCQANRQRGRARLAANANTPVLRPLPV